VGEHLPDHDICFVGIPPVLPVVTHFPVEVEFALIDKFHKCRQGSRDLCHRGKVVQVVRSDSFLAVVGEVAVTFMEDDLSVLCHEHLASGKRFLCQPLVSQGVELPGEKRG